MCVHMQKSEIRFLVIMIIVIAFGVLAMPQASAATDVWDGTVATSFAGGDGSSFSPYEIATGAQLAYLSALCNASDHEANAHGVHYILTNDIDLNGIQWTPIGDPNDSGSFYGNFDGKSHVISNLVIERTGVSGDYIYAGLFWLIKTGVIQNLGIEDIDIRINGAPTRIYAGGLAAWVYPGDVDDVEIPATIANCYTSGSILIQTTNFDWTIAGGLIGYGYSIYNADPATTFRNCCSTVDIRRENSYGYAYGGLIGHALSTSVQNCYAVGDVYFEGDRGYGSGGSLIGYINYGTCLSSYWNTDAKIERYYDGTVYDVSAAMGFDTNTTIVEATAETAAFMQTNAFVDLLNAEYASTGTWSIIDELNGGYPVAFDYAPHLMFKPSGDKVFDTQAEGYGAQTPYAVTVKNTGITETGVLGIALSGANASSFALSNTSMESITPGSTSSFTVVPVTGLSGGTYTATVTVSGDNVAAQTLDVSFTVEKAVYEITADPIEIDYGSEYEGYSAISAKTVTVKNTGDRSVTLTQPVATHYTIGALSQTTLAPSAEATFTVVPKTGLSAATYAEEIVIKGSNDTTASLDVTFTVEKAVYEITADPIEMDYGSEYEGYSAISAKTVTVKNTGNRSVTLTQPTATHYTIGALSQTTLAAGAETTFTVAPKTGLSAATYAEEIAIKGSNDTTASLDVTFTVEKAVYEITADPIEMDYGSEYEGYSAISAKTVTVKNTGNRSVTLTQPTATHYTIGALSQTTLAPSAEAMFTVAPKTGLSAATYTEEIAIEGSNDTTASLDVTFTVAASIYTITAVPAEHDFGSVLYGYGSVPSQSITVKNTGNGVVNLTRATSDNFEITEFSSTVVYPNDLSYCTIKPKAGLTVGTYTESIVVEGTGGAQATVDVTFRVEAVAYGVKPENAVFMGPGAGSLTFTSSGAFSEFIGVTLNGREIPKNAYSVKEGSTVVTLRSDYLSQLSAGKHKIRILFKDGYGDAALMIEAAPIVPQMGDSSHVVLWVALALLAFTALIVLRRKRFN